MTTGFQDDPSAPGRRVWRKSGGPAILSGFGTAVVGLVTLFMLGAAALGFRMTDGLWLGFFMLGLAAFMGALTAYVFRDMRGKLGGRITLDTAALSLDLPAGRSLMHRPPAARETVPLGDIEAVETRLEAYGAQTGSMMQRVWRLKRRSGPPIFLFEQRALGSALAERSMEDVAGEIAARAGAPMVDLGMAEGRGGILGAWFTAPPDWSATPLPAARQAVLWNRVYLTGVLMIVAVAVVLALSVIF